MLPPDNGEGVRYQLLERIGRGWSGEVFLAEASTTPLPGSQRLIERWPVAIKVLDAHGPNMHGPNMHGPDPHGPDTVHEGLEDARRLKALKYPRAFGPTEVVQLDKPHGSWAVVMDFVPGADLQQLVRVLRRRGETFPPRAAFQVAAGVLEALAAAHGAPGSPILHRSLSPADIRLSPRGEVNVVDFAVHRRAVGLLEQFCAPEQHHEGVGLASVTPQGDVYAAAAIVLWLLAEDVDEPHLLSHDVRIDSRLLRAAPMLGSSLAGRTGAALLRVALSSVAEDRPAARALGEAMSDVAKNLPGEDLSTFAARLVPVAAHPRPSEEGALERLTPSRPPVVAPRGSRLGFHLGFHPSLLLAVPFAAIPFAALGLMLLLWVLSPPQPDPLPLVVKPGPGLELIPPPKLGVLETRPTEAGEQTVHISEMTEDKKQTKAPALEPAQPERKADLVGDKKADQTAPAGSPRSSLGGGSPAAVPARIDRAHFSMEEASRLVVSCGEVSFGGTRSARITNFPAGPCRVTATVGVQEYTAVLELTEVSQVSCAVQEGKLSCMPH